nr:hypothetical protein BaRGS_002868 [Batillaria attramentaria]
MGDFNAKIGSDNTGYEDTMGTHGLGQMNENGERFANFCALNQLVIGGSIFPHKRIHKATWRSPDHVTENQIDHICISRKFRRSWRDVRVMRGADKLEVRKEKKTALNTSRTRRAKAKAQEEYTAADREVKRSTRKDKRDYIDNLASQAEEAARQGNLKDLYQVTKKLAGKFQQTDKPVKDKNGHPLTTTEEQLKRWAEHFRELLNRPIPETPPDIPPAETELPINCDKPSKAEIRKAIMTLRNGKAAGPDEIPAEAIKADTETAVNMLHSLFSKIWEKEEVPAQWKEGIVIKLPKKGDLRDCSNYRGIMLLSVPGKVLNRILLERMREAVDPMLRDQQAGFRRNRSCADQIASLRIIVEQSLEWNSPLYINFIDYEKAFDSVDREALWKLLRHYGVPGKIISLIQCTYQDMSCRIAHAGQLSESFEVKTGVRQGCLLSPFLFLLVIDWIMKTTTAGRKNGIQWTLWTQLDDLDFADDLALLSHSHSQMQDKTTRLEATSAGTGLKINRKKTELMKINTTANTPVTVGGEPIREVESFVYLGSVVDGQGGTDRDVTARIGKARAAMVMLKNVWASKVVSIRTKLRIFNSNVKSVLLYGCETWRTTKTMQQKIQTFLNTCLRRIFNIRWPEKIRNEELWERAGQEPVAKQILRRKWGWIGHTLRKPASSTTRQALTWNPQGKRKRGRPRNSWRRDTEAELCKQGTNWTGVAKLAQNRVRWRRVVDGLCSTWSQGPNAREGSNFPPDATIPAPKFVIRDFVVGSSLAIIGNITADGSKVQVIQREHDAATHALAAHPHLPHIAVGSYSGLLKIWNYETKTVMVSRTFDRGSHIRSCTYDPKGSYLVVGFTNGVVRVLDSITLHDEVKEPFHFARDAITQIAFSHDCRFFATADAEYTTSLFKAQGTADGDPFLYLGRYRAHYKPINDLLFGVHLDSNKPRLMSLGADRVMVEYDLDQTEKDRIVIASHDRIEQSAVPCCTTMYPPITKEHFILTANDQYKFKLYNATTKMCRKTLLGPTYGSPVQKICLVPTKGEEGHCYAAYITEDKVGMIILPLDGNPHNAMALIAHPNGISTMVPSHDGRYLFTAGGTDASVHMWEININALEAQAKLGGKELVPFYGLLEGGRHGELFAELEDYFYYAQIRSQGVNATMDRQVSTTIPLSEIPFVMRAMGFYPTEQEIEDMINEVKFSKYVENGRYVEELDLGTFIKLYVNHRPAFGLSPEKLLWAFDTLGVPTPQGGSIERGELLDILQSKGRLYTLTFTQPTIHIQSASRITSVRIHQY